MKFSGTRIVLALPASLLASPAGAQSLLVERHPMLPALNEQTLAVELTDIDGDGDLDAFFGNGLGFELVVSGLNRLHSNDGTARFLDVSAQLPADTDDTHAAAAADLDGDGDSDLVAGNIGVNRIYTNDGSGTFSGSTLPFALSDSTLSVAVGDIDADGDIDIVVGNSNQQNRLYRNDGSGGFSDDTASLPVASDATWDLALGDVENDGDLDIVLANSFDVALWRNLGAGLFEAAPGQLPLDGAFASAVALGDIDGDLDLDVVFADRLYRNDGSGAYTLEDAPVPDVPGGFAVRKLKLADLEDDGDLDMFLASGPYLNDGNGQFTAVAWSSPLADAGVRDLGLGDLDGDNDLDVLMGLAASGYEPGRNQLALGDGLGLLVDATNLAPSLPPIYEHTRSAKFDDLDGDGDLDVFAVLVEDTIGGSFETKTAVYLNEGGGYYTDGSAGVPNFYTIFTGVVLADADGDGDADAFVAGYQNPDGSAGSGDLLLNDGAAGFTYGDSFGKVNVESFDVADVDGDGDVDALVANDPVISITFFHELWLNDGAGDLEPAPAGQFPVYQDRSGAMKLGDVDGDGDPDALFGNRPLSGYSGQNRLFENTGGSFAESSGAFPISSSYTNALALGDIDNDGDLDVFVANTEANELYVNDGAGLFNDASDQIPADVRRTSGVAFGDLDSDGDLDALLANTDGALGASKAQLYLGDGTGTFVDDSAALPFLESAVNDVALADVDDDGDLDAFLSGSGPSSEAFHLGAYGFDHLWLNQSRHLAWRSIPRIGAAVTFDVCGEPAAPYAILYSTGTAAINVGFGTLFLDPSTLLTLTTGVLQTACDEYVAQIPNVPALAGETFHLQTLYAAPFGFSNPERLPVTAL